jgi:predicted Rossmann fold nucleotide-binding protein DprA/Smf involved in DNA uptake
MTDNRTYWLFGDPHRFGDAARARRRDPATSHESAARVTEFDANHFGRIMDVLKQFGPMTFRQIAFCLNMEGQQINKRLPELERMGAVVRTGETRPSSSGRQCAVWRAA